MKRAVQLVFVIAVLTTVAFGAPTLTFNSAGTTGTINYNPNYSLGAGNSTLRATASGIDIDNLFAAGFPQNNGGPISCDSCTLSFTTGIVTQDAPPLIPGNNFWSFGSGGSSFTIFGKGIDSVTFSSTPIALLSGSFNTPITVSTPNVLQPDTKFVASTIINSVFSGVTNYFGFPPGFPWTGDYSQTFTASRTRVNNSGNPSAGGSHVAFNSTVLSTGVVHDTATVPEPTSMVLFSTVAGLLGFTVYRRRKNG